MSKSKIIWTVLITVVVIVAVLGGGYALYRYGYARGAAADVGELMRCRFAGELGELGHDELGEHMMPWGRQSGMPGIGFRGYSMPGHWGGGFFGLLLGGGVLALAVYGVISLVRKNKASDAEVEVKSKSKK